MQISSRSVNRVLNPERNLHESTSRGSNPSNSYACCHKTAMHQQQATFMSEADDPCDSKTRGTAIIRDTLITLGDILLLTGRQAMPQPGGYNDRSAFWESCSAGDGRDIGAAAVYNACPETNGTYLGWASRITIRSHRGLQLDVKLQSRHDRAISHYQRELYPVCITIRHGGSKRLLIV